VKSINVEPEAIIWSAPYRAFVSLAMIGILGGCVVSAQVRAPTVVIRAPVALADVEIRTTVAPPPLPDYEQPPCPEDGYIWTPGYWHWVGGDYVWIPGTWVQPPRVGVLWTPGYWGFVGGNYGWHAGYWGPHVGFYGGVNYGFGYVGVGFAGGHWAGNNFAYNTTVNNVNSTVVHNTYNTTVVNNITINKVSYNGGSGGITATASAQERAAAQEPHVPPTPMQRQHVQEAIKNPALAAKANGGHPSIAATSRPAVFTGSSVTRAHGASAAPANAAAAPPTNAPRAATIAAPSAPLAKTPPLAAPKPPTTAPKKKKPPQKPKIKAKDEKDH
jgi:WXXGXW repeat (2 copies)